MKQSPGILTSTDLDRLFAVLDQAQRSYDDAVRELGFLKFVKQCDEGGIDIPQNLEAEVQEQRRGAAEEVIMAAQDMFEANKARIIECVNLLELK